MSKLFEMKGYIMKYYSKYSAFVDKIVQFLVAFLTFTYINRNLGFLDILSKPVTTIILSVICMLLPMPAVAILATVVVLIQIFMVSWGMALVALALFVIMYAFYFRYAPGKAVLILLVPIAFMFEIPMVIPIVYGLIGTPVCVLPIVGGTILHYLVQHVKSNATFLQSVGEADLAKQIYEYAEQIMFNPELWCTILAFTVSLLLVYVVRKMSVDYSWEIAIVVGVLANINVLAYGYIIVNIPISYAPMIAGSIASIVICLILKLFVYAVEYTRTEYLQFEDDAYYYYVKAIPKVSVAIREKTVKMINQRRRTDGKSSERARSTEKKSVVEKNVKQQSEDSEIQKIIDKELKQDR